MKTYRPLFVFYFLIFYIFASYFWWAYLLFQKNELLLKERVFITENHIKSSEKTEALAQLHQAHQRQKWMIIGEGCVFVMLISLGAWQIRRSFLQEIELNKQQRNFLLSITHELKTPLASIQLALQTLQTKKPNETQGERLMNNSLQDVERLKVLVDKILIATKIETDQEQFIKEEVNVSELLSDCIATLKNKTGSQANIQSTIEEQLYLNADPTALDLIISNLLDNAIKYSPNEIKINIDLSKKNDKLVLSVSDCGVGISDENKKQIFKKFYRVGSEETRTSKGTGLGLYLVKQLVEMYNGTINVHDNQPNGSVFMVAFSN
jgi:signal transduction histidine kinase